MLIPLMFPQHKSFPRVLSWAAALILLGGSIGLSRHVLAKSTTTPVKYLSGRVVGVADGDTITVLVNKKGTKVRLYGVDAPEKKQAFGQRAKQFTSNLVFDRDVRVSVVSMDRYQRTVGIVTRKDGVNLNEELLSNGWAWWYEHYAKREQRYAALEKKARDSAMGLWSEKDPVPPWEFRRKSLTPLLSHNNVSRPRQH